MLASVMTMFVVVVVALAVAVVVVWLCACACSGLLLYCDMTPWQNQFEHLLNLGFPFTSHLLFSPADCTTITGSGGSLRRRLMRTVRIVFASGFENSIFYWFLGSLPEF